VWSEAEDTAPKRPEPPKPRGNGKGPAKRLKKVTSTTGVGRVQRRGRTGFATRPKHGTLNLGTA